MKKIIVYILLIGLYLLHNDLWLWNNPDLVLGMPVGLFYHVVFCAAVMVVMMLLVIWAWPEYAATDAESPEERP